jgi:hypothetical protein
MVQAWTVFEIRRRIANLAVDARQFTRQSILSHAFSEPSSG